MSRVEFTHSNQAKIGQIGIVVSVAPCQLLNVTKVGGKIKSRAQQSVFDQRKHVRARPQMECGFRQYCLACEQGFCSSPGDIERPGVMLIVAPGVRHD